MHYLSLITIFLTLPTPKSAFSDTDLWRNACPFSDSCTRGPLKEFKVTGDEISQPCCRSCSCDNDCWLFKDCCPDVTHTAPAKAKHPAMCKNLIIGAVSGVFNKYRVMDFCPSDFNVSEVANKCLGQLDADIDNLRDVVAVSDVNDRIYRNRWCALCNGKSDVVSWKLQLIKCENNYIKEQVIAATFLQDLTMNCVLESVPPNAMVKARMDRKVCGLRISFDCPSDNSSGSQNIVDECLNGHPVNFMHKQSDTKIGYFKNVFCFLCRNDVVKHTVCPVPAENIPGKHAFSRSSLMLNMAFGEHIQANSFEDTLAVSVCNEQEIYDPFKQRCHKVFCPRFHAVSYGKCLKFGTPVANYGVELRLHYEPKENFVFSEGIHIYDFKTTMSFVGAILEEYGLKRCNVMDFFLGAFLDENTRLAYIEVKIKLLFAVVCPLDDVIKTVRNLLFQQNELSLVINDVKVRLSGRIHFFEEIECQEGYKMHVLLNTHGPITNIDYNKEFFLCPYIILDRLEYHAIVKEVLGQERALEKIKLSRFTPTEPGFFPLSGEAVAVCVDTYFAFFEKREIPTNGDPGHHPAFWVANAVLVAIISKTYIFYLSTKAIGPLYFLNEAVRRQAIVAAVREF